MNNHAAQPHDSSRNQPNQPIWKIAECAAVGASIIGVFASAVSAQVAYFAAPASLSLCLNLINRYRWEKQSQQLSGGMARLYRRIDEMEQSALTLPPAYHVKRSDAATAWEAIEQLQDLTNERLDRLTREQSQIHLRLSQLSSQTADLDQESRAERRLVANSSPQLASFHSFNGKDPNSSLLKDLESRISRIEDLDIIAQNSALEQLKQLIDRPNPILEQRLQEQHALISQMQERLESLADLEVEDRLLEVLQLHLRLYKWQQELTAEINQRLTPVVAEMQLGRQRYSSLEAKVKELSASQPGDGKTSNTMAN